MSTHVTPADLAAALGRIHPDAVDAHLRFLSHPLMEGRGPGTRGGDTAQEYIRAQFRRATRTHFSGGEIEDSCTMSLSRELDQGAAARELGTDGDLIEETLDRQLFRLRRAVPFEECRDWALNGEQAKCEIDERLELLDLRFERGQSCVRFGRGAWKWEVHG